MCLMLKYKKLYFLSLTVVYIDIGTLGKKRIFSKVFVGANWPINGHSGIYRGLHSF